ncbi:response regulator [Salininema proteolyticum]|uniref:Transcriptional regulatory protein n=1 Tax=Salininema proteolyticum TaxID=1607685 RepID=A0ABV8U0A2_9ACTN
MIEVLIVDDDFRVASIHSRFVEAVDGFRTMAVAHSGAEALETLRTAPADLVLLDLYLPDVFGLDLAARLRSEGHDCDIIAITAAREAETVQAAVRHGLSDYLLKPFGLEDLRKRLEDYAARVKSAPRQVHDQSDVDRILSRSGRTALLPKGLSAETAASVENALKGSDTLSATECAEAVGISRVGARRYLEYLHESGKASVKLRYAKRGRPERRYRFL